MKLEQIYKDIKEAAKLIQISEIGEGSLLPFEYTLENSDPLYAEYLIKGYSTNPSDNKQKITYITLELDNRPVAAGNIELGLEGERLSNFMKVAKIDNLDQKLNLMNISFHLTSEYKGDYYNTVNDKTFMFRLMSTLKQILSTEIEARNIDAISYVPTQNKSNNIASVQTRHKLYSAFIKKAIPNAREWVVKNAVVIYFIN
jgi:hypothetical protein